MVKKIVSILVLVLMVLTVLTGCKKSLPELEYKDTEIFNANLSDLRNHIVYNKEIVINSKEEHQKLLDSIPIETRERFNASLVDIDFSKYTLLGKHVYGGDVSLKKNVVYDKENKKIIYSIKLVSKSNNDIGFTSMNWILIPKIKPEDTVIFEVKRE